MAERLLAQQGQVLLPRSIIEEKTLQDLGDPELEVLRYTCDCINRFFQILNYSGCFLSEEVRREVAACGQYFLEGYASVASSQASQGYPCFKLRPKYHMFAELVHRLGRSRFNILGSSCWADEDFIGVCSRTARSCSSGQTGLSMSIRAIQKILGQHKAQFRAL